MDPCTFLGWWSSPYAHWVVWPAHIVLPMRLQFPSAHSVLPPASYQGPQAQFDSWLQASALFSCLQNLLRVTLDSCQQAPLGKSNSVVVCCLQTGWILRWGSLWMALLSVSEKECYVADSNFTAMLPLSASCLLQLDTL